uniref:(northern house mosquito) hypothetical protein n=1 Tax=Culex pipiens TaxID=7175 RepID=A0A8D8FQ56_CULPI
MHRREFFTCGQYLKPNSHLQHCLKRCPNSPLEKLHSSRFGSFGELLGIGHQAINLQIQREAQWNHVDGGNDLLEGIVGTGPGQTGPLEISHEGNRYVERIAQGRREGGV